MRKLLVFCLAVLVCPILFGSPAILSADDSAVSEKEESAKEEKAVELTGYVGSESCLDCHEEQTESFAMTVHGNKANPKTPAAGLGCEACHGPREQHVEDGGGEDSEIVFGLTSDTPISRQNEMCLKCHSGGKLALWDGSEHYRRDLACISCHSGHKGYKNNLQEKSEPETCAQCHKDVRSQLMRNSHHPIREGKMTCSDCHNSHGTIADGLIDADDLNEKCYECHAEKRGPFLWQHDPVSEDCMTCHVPHGSTHDKLLVGRTPYLCQRCHSNARHPGTLYGVPSDKAGESVYSALNNRGYYRSCLNCHTQVHGSNHPSGKSLAR